jgi:DNA-binding CsgD family transcriptional regulator
MACAPKAFVAGLKERRERAARYVQAVKDLLDGTGVPVRDDQLHEHSLAGTVRPLYGIPKTRARIAELTSASDREHSGMSPQPAFSAESVRAAAPAERAAAVRGVPSMGLFVPRAADDESIELGIEMRSYGAQFRYLPELPVKMLIFDRKTVILPLDQADLPKGAWEITTPSIVDALVSLFLQRWERAEPPNLDRKNGMVLTTREREIVSLLAEGLTDDGVAAKLNISRRSISYAIAGMMERYHAKNRFQLGLMLGAQTARQQSRKDGERKHDEESNELHPRSAIAPHRGGPG